MTGVRYESWSDKRVDSQRKRTYAHMHIRKHARARTHTHTHKHKHTNTHKLDADIRVHFTISVHGVWSAWGAWSECSVTCAGGKQKRKRECTVPLYGGQPCLGHNVELRPCASTPCPVNGDWSTWSQWGSCSVTCSNGTRTRERKCDRPVPAYGGRACVGERYESATCFEVECPGEWCGRDNNPYIKTN